MTLTADKIEQKGKRKVLSLSTCFIIIMIVTADKIEQQSKGFVQKNSYFQKYRMGIQNILAVVETSK